MNPYEFAYRATLNAMQQFAASAVAESQHDDSPGAVARAATAIECYELAVNAGSEALGKARREVSDEAL